MWINLRDKNFKGPVHGGGFHNLGSLTSRRLTRISQWITKKNHLMFPEGRGGKEQFWNIPQYSILNKVCSPQKLFYQSLTCWSLSEPQLLGERKYLTLAPSRHPIPPKVGSGVEGEALRSRDEVHSPGAQPYQKTDTKSKDQRSLPLPRILYHYVTKGLFTAVPFTQHIMSASQQNITRCAKRFQTKTKTQLEEIEQASEPEWNGRNVLIIRPGFFFNYD